MANASSSEREVQLQAARERMRRRGMLGDLAIRSMRERTDRFAHAHGASATDGTPSMFERLQSNVDDAPAAPPWEPPPRAPPGAPRIIETVLEADLGDGDVCAVCLEGCVCGEAVVALDCGHAFHGKCVRQWLATAVGCPTCRARVPRDVTEEERATPKGDGGLGAIMQAVRAQRERMEALRSDIDALELPTTGMARPLTTGDWSHGHGRAVGAARRRHDLAEPER